ncbi:MAG: hypothetical protein DI585_06000 [Pseudomonas fluorescens]|nr:MAG: hypothetical protein DI585_06000 [Pseudomonas fluorescens]
MALAAPALLCPLSARAELLVYKDANKWVAQEDNKPLMELMAKARDGKTTYKVGLPDGNRELSVQRLEIIRDILAREAKTAVIIEEVGGSAKANTIRID